MADPSMLDNEFVKSRLGGEDAGRVNAESRHVLALDGVRGLAILAVLGSHLLISNNVATSAFVQLLLNIRDLLWVGVTLFFSLSGFLITGILFDTLGSENYFRTFFGRRALRIFPLYYGVVLGLLLLTRPLHLDWNGQAWHLLTYTTNMPFAMEWASNPSRFINLRHFWSLAVEEQFYLIWPLVIFWLRDWRKIFIATLVGAGLSLGFRTSLAMSGMGPQNHTLFGCMDALLLGGTLALLVRSEYRERVLAWGTPVFLAAVTITLAEAFRHKHFTWGSSLYLTTIGMTILSLGMTGLVAASLRVGSVAQIVCRNSVLRFFGRYSYGLYVYHYSMDTTFTWPMRDWFGSHGLSKAAAILMAAAVVMAISIMISVASYHLYEKHFLRLKRYLPNKKVIVTEEMG
jgi:peptidoglycan/LPS O-acetylase OafA/YrhL